MTRIIKRTISLLTVLTLAFTMCLTTGISVFAEDEEPGADINNIPTEEGTLNQEGEGDTVVDDEAIAEDDAAAELQEVIPISAPITPVVSDFTDITGHWAAISIDFVVRLGIFTGVGDGRFDPDGVLTRGMLVTVLGRYDEAPVAGYWSTFTDVNADQYYAPYVAWAAQNGIVLGTGDSKFEPDAIVTREQAARIISSYIRYSNKIPRSTRIYRPPFTDEAAISSWALEDVNMMRFYELIEGRSDGSFNPFGSLTRAEASTILKRFIENAPRNRLEF